MTEEKQPKFKRNKEGKIKRITDAFLKMLNKMDYNEISTNKIAEEAGVSIGTIYNYFDNKEDILQSIFENITEEFVEMEEIVKIVKEREEKAIEKFIRNYLKSHQEYYLINKAHDQAMIINQEVFLSFQENIRGYIDSFLQAARKRKLDLGTTTKENFTKAFLVGLTIIDNQVHLHLFRKQIFDTDKELVNYLTKIFKFTLNQYLD
jgi:AcrR family transcriptional regulator